MTSLRPERVLAHLATAACLSIGGNGAQAADATGAGERSLFRGWVTYQIACSSCHGPDAVGIGMAPDLLARLRELSLPQFLQGVTTRYRVTLGLTESLFSDSQRQSVLAEVGPRAAAGSGAAVMPSWQSDAVIRARVLDLHAYLKARSEGALGPGRPETSGP